MFAFFVVKIYFFGKIKKGHRNSLLQSLKNVKLRIPSILTYIKCTNTQSLTGLVSYMKLIMYDWTMEKPHDCTQAIRNKIITKPSKEGNLMEQKYLYQ